MPKLDLRSLILLLTFASTMLAVSGFIYASYQVQRELLIEQTLEANRSYAAKLADSSNDFLVSAHMQLRYSAQVLSAHFDDFDVLRAEANRLKDQSQSFNLVAIIDADGRLLINAPLNRTTVGSVLDSKGVREALIRRRPLISEPYISASNRLVVAISEPLYDTQGLYLGYVAGLIHLHEKNILNDLLGKHPYRDGSYLYVVGRQSQLIYHQDVERLGQRISGNPVIKAVLAGQHGSQALVNSKGVAMLAGYAPIAEANWGVVAQRPLAATLEDLHVLAWRVVTTGVPFLMLLVVAIWWISWIISKPLRQLALSVRQTDGALAASEIGKVRSWYFEAAQLKRAILDGLELLNLRIGKLNTESVTDPLTGLLNRRGVQMALAQWIAAKRPFAVISIDIDHFKQVNDNHGHDIGDLTIQFLAEQMRQVSRANDLLSRSGGEEFSMLLPEVTLEQAAQVAERLRERMENLCSPTGAPVTISIGIAHSPEVSSDLKTLLKAADEALYSAKRGGRNRVVLAPSA